MRVGVLVFIGWTLYIMSAFGMFDKDYSVTDLKDNFRKKQAEIYQLKKYFNSIVPKNRFVELNFRMIILLKDLVLNH